MGYNLLINEVYWGELTHLLTFDPNFLGHPSGDEAAHGPYPAVVSKQGFVQFSVLSKETNGQ